MNCRCVQYPLALFALISLLLAGCGKASSSPSADPIVGAYKCGAKYSKTEDGAVQPGYWYFKKNGKLLYCVPQIAHNEHFHPRYEVSHGTWKRLGNNRYQINLRSDYEGDSFNLKGSLENDHLTIPAAKGRNKEVTAKSAWPQRPSLKCSIRQSGPNLMPCTPLRLLPPQQKQRNQERTPT